MKLTEAIGRRIKGLLAERGMTQYQLAKQCGIPRSTVWKIVNAEAAGIHTVKLDTLCQIADTLGLSLRRFFDDWLFDGVSD